MTTQQRHQTRAWSQVPSRTANGSHSPKTRSSTCSSRTSPCRSVAATVIAETTITTPGQVPIPFEISYDQSGIVPQNTYAIRATITVDGVLWFTNTTAYPVITQGNPSHVDMVLTFVRGGQ